MKINYEKQERNIEVDMEYAKDALLKAVAKCDDPNYFEYRSRSADIITQTTKLIKTFRYGYVYSDSKYEKDHFIDTRKIIDYCVNLKKLGFSEKEIIEAFENLLFIVEVPSSINKDVGGKHPKQRYSYESIYVYDRSYKILLKDHTIKTTKAEDVFEILENRVINMNMPSLEILF